MIDEQAIECKDTTSRFRKPLTCIYMKAGESIEGVIQHYLLTLLFCQSLTEIGCWVSRALMYGCIVCS